MTTYRLIYTNRAVKDIEKLDIVAKRRLKKALEKLALSPQTHSSKLIDPKIGEYRFKVGNHRVIFDLVGEEIVILRVGHRREIYR
ncbi:MAG: type II toxin-antitoxin system RelE/ParE family toxin [Candidatus Subteraquimicrobiales bacterium]|nr:type II toxin-antitoxin system RelE/ParE family toxin [Candidatus Subteraquimicrobiales bacterium]